MLQYFYGWHIGNSDNPEMLIDGRVWFYLSAKKISSAFPYFTDKQVRTIVEHLVELELVYKANHSKNTHLRTIWYSLTDYALEFFNLPETANASAQMGKPFDEKGKCEYYNKDIIDISSNEDNINIDKKEKSSKRKVFVKPTVEEIAEYCRERGNNIDPQEFFDHYESNGWIVGRSPMKDWKAAVRTWEKRHSLDARPAAKPERQTLSEYYRDLAKKIGLDKPVTISTTNAEQYGQPYDFAADFGADEQ